MSKRAALAPQPSVCRTVSSGIHQVVREKLPSFLNWAEILALPNLQAEFLA
jgi:hypothetical protein